MISTSEVIKRPGQSLTVITLIGVTASAIGRAR